MFKQLRVGLVGLGEVSQILHLPTLAELCDIFKVTAMCDLSPTVLQGVSADYPHAHRFADPLDLCRCDDVDIVLVASPNVYHAEIAIAAMEAGKHVLIEKPMCLSLEQADTLAEVQARTGAIVQIGYMRRHAPAFEQGAMLVAEMGDTLTLARVHDVIGPNSAFIASTSRVIRANDIAPDVLAASNARQAQVFDTVIGTDKGPRALAYHILLGLGSHDTSAMREMIGMPKSVLYAQHRHGGRFIMAAFDYDGFICQFEIGIDNLARFDCFQQFNGPTQIVRVDYNTPYIRHQPTVLSVTQQNTDFGVTTSTGHPTRGDAFVVQWQRFHADVIAGLTGKCSIADAREDLVLFRDMMAVMN